MKKLNQTERLRKEVKACGTTFSSRTPVKATLQNLQVVEIVHMFDDREEVPKVYITFNKKRCGEMKKEIKNFQYLSKSLLHFTI